MSALQVKSQLNLNAAEVLHKGSLYAPGVHCSYYSCLQMMYFIIFEKVKRPKSEQAYSDDASHKYAFNAIMEELFSQKGRGKLKDANDIKVFQNYFTELKKLRVKSDYSEESISPDQSQKAYDTAQSLLRILGRYF